MLARAILATAAAILLVGCGSRQPSGAAGLSGTVIVSPATPVCRTGSSCSRPARGLTLVFSREGNETGKVKTDGHGRYRIALAAGRYAVRVAHARLGSGLAPGTVTVRSGAFGNVHFRYDPGIR
jgi:hypothetical protein